MRGFEYKEVMTEDCLRTMFMSRKTACFVLFEKIHLTPDLFIVALKACQFDSSIVGSGCGFQSPQPSSMKRLRKGVNSLNCSMMLVSSKMPKKRFAMEVAGEVPVAIPFICLAKRSPHTNLLFF